MQKLKLSVIALIMGTAILTDSCVARIAEPDPVRPVSHAISTTENTALRRALAPAVNAHAGLSGFHLVTKGHEALALRLAMIDAAQRSLDLQYYSIQNDITGKLILAALLRAADRGVRVRLLFDDLSLKKSDPIWALIQKHDNVEIRVFNPFITRKAPFYIRMGNLFSGHFVRRMHNKDFIADNQIAIVGGRNLGDAYFDNSGDFNFRDIDIFVAGSIVAKVSRNFDTYWNGKEAYPLEELAVPPTDTEDMAPLRAGLEAHWREFMEGTHLRIPSLLHDLAGGGMLEWAPVELAADSPEKLEKPREDVVSKPASRLEKLVENAREEFLVTSPYFVPGDDGVAWLDELVARGVRVRVLTNSLASTDVVAVHTGYRRYRTAVLQGGVELYELQPRPGPHPRPGRFASASRASLHTKIYVVDRRTVLIGTFNLDPRSVELNTEIALVVHSPALAVQVAKMFERAVAPDNSFQVTLDDMSNMQWRGRDDEGREKLYTSDPSAGFWRHVKADLYAVLPFEDEL